GAATLSTALNSNTLNVVGGLMLPGVVFGIGQPSGETLLVTAWYAGLTLAVLVLAWRLHGLSRRAGAAIIAAYAAFALSLILISYASSGGTALVISLGLTAALILLFAMRPTVAERSTSLGTSGLSPRRRSHQHKASAVAEAVRNGLTPRSHT